MKHSWLLTFTITVFSSCLQPSTGNDVHDLIFLMDASRSTGEANFRALLQAVVDFVSPFPVSQEKVHVGIVSFSNTLEVISLTGNMTHLETEVQDMFYEGRYTYSNLALREARTMLESSHSRRVRVQQSVVVVSDGVSRLPPESKMEAEMLRQEGVDVWAVAIGSNIRLAALTDLTGNFSRVVQATSFDALPDMDLGISIVTLSTSQPVVAPGTITPSATSTSPAPSTGTATTTANASEGRTTSSTPSLSNPVIESTTPQNTNPSTTTTGSLNINPSTTSTAPSNTNPSIIATSGPPNINPSTTSTAPSNSNPSTTSIAPSNSNPSTTSTAPSSTNPSIAATSGPPNINPSTTYTAPSNTDWSTTTSGTPWLQPSRSATRSVNTERWESTPSLASSTRSSLWKTDQAPQVSSTPVPTSTRNTPASSSTSAIYVPDTGRDADADATELGVIPSDDSIRFDNIPYNAGLCSRAKAKRGFAFESHPLDCDKFVQCHLSDEGHVTGSVRVCPTGMHWHQGTLDCVHPRLAKCVLDPCRTQVDWSTIKMNRGCALYWECDNGVSNGRACYPYHAYVPGMGCVFMPECRQSQHTGCINTGICALRPLSGGRGYTTSTLLPEKCYAGMKFDLASCSCQAPLRPHKQSCSYSASILSSNDKGHQLIYNLDRDVQNFEMEHESKRPITVRFRYRPLTNETRDPKREEILLRSRACDEGGLFTVSEHLGFVRVRIFSEHGHPIWTELPTEGMGVGEWREIVVEYSRGQLTAYITVPGLTYTSFTVGDLHMQVGGCGWAQGDAGDLGPLVGHFTGQIEGMSVSRC